MRFRSGLAVVLCALCLACAQSHYASIHSGILKGRLVVEWMQPELFLFRPDATSPLTFTRANGTVIRPQRMLTDGGSIPRPVQALRNYSPWGYGPAFVMHDWLFHVQNCRLPGWKDWTVDEAATVMSEVMKTMMESPKFNYGDRQTVYAMYLAVKSPPARAAWNNGQCLQPPSETADTWRPTAKFVVEF